MRTLLSLALAAALLAPFALADVPRSETKAYIAAGGDNFSVCGEDDPAADIGIGGVCFLLDGSESAATLTIADTSGFDAGLYYEARAGGMTLTNGAGCGSVDVDLVDLGADELRVWVDQALVALDCAPGAGLPGTMGSVTADFS